MIKNLKTHIIFSFVILIPFINLFAQVNQINYVPITSENGLSQNTVHDIFLDSKGYLWFATEDGLNKYDGYKFTVYKNVINDSNSISDNFIWTINEDKKGTLWIGTNNGGLCSFNRDSDKFTTYRNNPNDPNSLGNNNVRSICEDKNGNLWVGTEGGGLNELKPGTKKFIHYYSSSNPNSISDNIVLVVYQDHEGNIWAGGNSGLNLLNKDQKTFTRFQYDPHNPYSINSNLILSIFEDKDSTLWIGTIDGLNKFDRGKNRFIRYYNTADKNNSNSNTINDIVADNTGMLWIGTGGGIFQFDKSSGKFTNVHQFSSTNSRLRNHNILSIAEDNSGLIWVGTAEDGIIKFDREKQKFLYFAHNPSNQNSLSYNTIRSLYMDRSGLLWIGTLGGGLDLYNMKSGRFVHYKHNASDPSSLSDNKVSAIFRDKSGTLWVGTWGSGLNRMTGSRYDEIKGRAKFVHYNNQPDDSSSLNNDIIQKIFQDSEGRLWIATGRGLDLYNKTKNSFHSFEHDPENPYSLSNNIVQSCMIEDKSGNIWIGTWDGLNKLVITKNPGTQSDEFKFYHFRNNPNSEFSISDNRIISILQDSHGNLWIGTYGGGLNELTSDQLKINDDSKVKFNRYSIKDGLPSSIIYGILEDGQGNLWLSTDNGLSKFDPKTLVFRNYYESDGLQGNQFYWGAYCKGKNGELFFGGTNGLNAFYPVELRKNNHIPPIVITDFQIFNKPVPIGGKNSPLKEAISSTKEITLSYSQNVFSLEYAALDFTSPSKNDYAYMMEGFDKNWVMAGNRRFVTYTNLDPGEYTFRVKGSNNDGVWNEKGASIKFIILPPFYRTWWFIIISSIFIGGIVLLIIYVRVKHLLDIERFRTKLAADLHDNIGSGLTEISILSEVIAHKLDSVDDHIKSSLNKISENSRNLIDSMSDIVWLVNPNRDSLYDLILRLRDTYTELSSYASISFRSENIKSLEKVSLSMEHRQNLYLIFKEGINNCITHSGCTEISLDAFVRGKGLEMVLKDNGKGFDINSEYSGNGLENMKRRAEAIGGKINLSSKPGEGTELHFFGNIL